MTKLDMSTFDWQDCCFHRPNVFEYKGNYYEFIADPTYVEPCYTHPFRIIFHEFDYDYIESPVLTARLWHAYQGQKALAPI